MAVAVPNDWPPADKVATLPLTVKVPASETSKPISVQVEPVNVNTNDSPSIVVTQEPLNGSSSPLQALIENPIIVINTIIPKILKNPFIKNSLLRSNPAVLYSTLNQGGKSQKLFSSKVPKCHRRGNFFLSLLYSLYTFPTTMYTPPIVWSCCSVCHCSLLLIVFVRKHRMLTLYG